MEEVRQLVQEEGREARNLVAFHVAVDPPGKIVRKPPRAGPSITRSGPSLPSSRHRSASAGRDKRSELRARYWALLFGDLQRAVGEIYNTVETHENLSECQEVILVLENYTRDFKALGEWFRLKWEYDNTPPLQRPQSLAWEIRKTDFVAPGPKKCQSARSSPSVSGKNSPSLSGHNTPSGKNSPSLLSGKVSPGSGKISPRIFAQPITSPKANIEFFSNKISSKAIAIPEPKLVKEPSRLSDITERNSVEENSYDTEINKDLKKKIVSEENNDKIVVELGTAKQSHNESPKQVIVQSNKKTKEIKENLKVEKPLPQKYSNTNDEGANKDKNVNKRREERNKLKNTPTCSKESKANEKVNSTNRDLAINKILNKMENEFLTQHLSASEAKNENINNDKCSEIEPETQTSKQSNTDKESEEYQSTKEEAIIKVAEIHKEPDKEKTLVEDESKNNPKPKGTSQGDEKIITEVINVELDIKKSESKTLSTANTTAYSQAAAKPKTVVTKLEVKPKVMTNANVAKNKAPDPKNINQKLSKTFPKRNQISKCSYPFNLTTGRTLFDNNNRVNNTKKPLIRNTQSSGDPNSSKLPPKRPATLKIEGKGDVESKNKTQLEKIKDIDEYGSSETVITQIDMSRIESNESLKTLVPEDLQIKDDVASSIEVLNLNDNDNEGWLTVKSRRLSRESKKQSKSHWANRYNQPSATTSLPTLNMMESPKQENRSIIDQANANKLDRAKSEQPQMPKPDQLKESDDLKKEELNSKEEVKKSEQSPKHQQANASILRQKSDITGLKTKSSRNKVLSKRADKVKNSPTSDEDNAEIKRLHSSLESLTSLSHEIDEESFDFDKWKEEFKKSLKYLQDEEHLSNENDNEILKSADPFDVSEIEEMTSQIEENERKISLALDFQSDVDQKKLCEEEDLLNRQILELQQVSDVDLDTETDDTETDAELVVDVGGVCGVPPSSLGPLATSLEDQYEPALAGLSWAERVDTLATLEALVARYPGRAQTIHAKLSQGIRRRGSLQETLKRYQAKQARAEQQRQELQLERSKKIQQLLAKVEEVKVAKNQLVEERRLRMERRLQKAAQNRNRHLKDIVRKAHDEEEKLREIAFIKQLEAEHRRHDFLEQCSSHVTRLKELRRDRLHKLERQWARSAAAGARRVALEEARRAHVTTLLQRRRERENRCEERKEMLRQERGDAAREKAEGVKCRLEALAAAAELEADALRHRIQHKQDATRRRHDTHLQAIRTRASAKPAPNNPDGVEEIKDSPPEEEIVEDKIKDVKALKKKCKKLKQRLILESVEDSEPNEEVSGIVKQTPFKINKLMTQLYNLVLPFIQQADLNTNYTKMLADIEEEKHRNKEIAHNGEEISNNEDLDTNVANTAPSGKKAKNKSKKKNKGKDINGFNDMTESTDSNNDVHTNNLSESNANNMIDRNIETDGLSDIKNIETHKTSEIYITNGNKQNVNGIDDLKNEVENGRKKKSKKKSKNKIETELTEDNVNDTKESIAQTDNNTEQLKGDQNIINTMNDIDIQISQTNSTSKSKNKKKNKKGKEVLNNEVNLVNGDVIENDKLDSEPTKINSEAALENNKKSKNKNKKDRQNAECGIDKPNTNGTKKKDNNNNLLDIASLEKILTDIYRHIEKIDKMSPDLWMIEKLRGIEIFGYLLLTVAEPHLFPNNQLSHKWVCTLCLVVSRVWSRSGRAAVALLASRAAPHLATILAAQLEQEPSNVKYNHLPVVIADCLSVALDAVMMRTRPDEGQQADSRLCEGDQQYAIYARSRAHLLISYLCYTGALARAEFASDKTKASMHTLITICCELCLPSVYDSLSFRVLAAAALKCSLGPNVSGARPLFCALFAGGAGVGDAGGGFVRAARTTRLLKSLALLDHTIVQEAFGSGSWLLEFRAAVSRLLAEHAPTDREAPRRNPLYQGSQRLDKSISETLVLDLITLVGLFVLDHQVEQDTICEGWSTVKILCNLPAAWIVSSPHNHILLPTLVALRDHPSAAAIINKELNTEMLDEFIRNVQLHQCPSSKLITLIRQSKNI